MSKFKSRPSGRVSNVGSGLNTEHLEQAVIFLKTAYRSEEPRDYADPDGDSWGPALGAAAIAAKAHNASLKKLVSVFDREIARRKGRF